MVFWAATATAFGPIKFGRENDARNECKFAGQLLGHIPPAKNPSILVPGKWGAQAESILASNWLVRKADQNRSRFRCSKECPNFCGKKRVLFQWVSFLGFEASKTHAVFGTSFWAQILDCKSVNKNRSQFPQQNQA